MGAQAVRLSNVDINNALENKDFEVLFQPIFDLSNGALARMETFVRWRHPSLGVLPPGAFISFFESQGRMSELTRYVLDVALESYAEWRGPYAPGFSINLALTDLTDEAFAPHLEKVLRDKEFPADLVTLECPMPAVNAAMDALNAAFERLQETGARLAIEVRGRANEFLRTVDPFPFDEIKTGGSSILRFARTVRGPGLSAISDLLDIAQKANAVTTAVGVEDQASLAALRGLGFTAAQGNHLAKVGDLKDFRPSRVNDVRESLELPALSGDELSALFRTAAPEPKAPAPETEPPAPASDVHASEPDDNEQSVSATTEDTLEPATAEQNAEAAKTDAERQALLERARKKAKAIALAKRAKARDARKAAAIKRAKAKVVRNNEATPELPPLQESDDAGLDPVAEPRALQDRLAQEFKDSETAAEEEINAAFDAGLDDGEETDITANFGVTEPIVDETPAPKESAVAHQAEDNVVAENEEAPHPAPLATDEQLSESNEPGKQSIQLQLPIGPRARAFPARDYRAEHAGGCKNNGALWRKWFSFR